MKLRVLLLVCGLLAGCASPPVSFYQLHARAPLAPERVSTSSVQIGPVSLPAALDRAQLVLGQGNRVTVLDQSRWAGSLSRMIGQTLADDISRELGLSQVHGFPQPSPFPSDYTVLIEVRALQGVVGQGVRLDASWSVQQGGRSIRQGRFVTVQAAQMAGVDGLVDAYDQALQSFGHTLAQVLNPLL